MAPSKLSVYITSFVCSATKDDVLDFVQPSRPINIRLCSQNNDPRGEKVAFVDFADEGAALSLIAKKHLTRFMGQPMRLRLAPADLNNNDEGSPSTNNNRSFQKLRSSPQLWTNTQRRSGQKVSSRPRDTPREVARGSFKIITSVSCTHFVALETGWQKDMEDLAQGLEDYANFAKCGVESMVSGVVYACKEPATGKWRRCRKIAEQGGAILVELIDVGGPTVVTKDQVLLLSQLYRDWRIKSVDIFLDGYEATSGSNESSRRIEEHLLNKTLQLVYLSEKTGPLMRDRVRVREMKLNGGSVLDELVQKGLLLKQHPSEEDPQQVTSTPLRPMTKSVTTLRTLLPLSSRPEQNAGHTPYCVKLQPEPVQPMDVDMNIPSQDAKHCEGQSDRGDVTQTLNRAEAEPAWNIRDWSASPPKKSPAIRPSQLQTPVASVTARETASPAAVVDTQSPTQDARAIGPMKCEAMLNVVDGSTRRTQMNNSKQEPSALTLERLVIADNTVDTRSDVTEPSEKLQAMARLVGGRAVQQMIRDRIAGISAELGQMKVHITGLSLSTSQSGDALTELRNHRRTAQTCVQDLEEIIQLASPDTLESYQLSVWAQFVGRIWSPMMNILFFNEQPLCVYKGSVIRRAEIEMGLSVEDDPRITVIIERAIDPSKIFKLAQDLATYKSTAKVRRVFFSEDHCKVFAILDFPDSDEALDNYGRQTVDSLLGSGLIG